MADELRKKAFRKQLKALCPTVENLRLMLGAARHAFNRHSQAELEKMAQIQDDITLDIDPMLEQVESGLEKATEADRPELLKLQEILSHLEFMADEIAGLEDPIRRKSNRGAIFADKYFVHINQMFTQQAGLLRSLVDIFQVDDAPLKAYVLQESQKLQDSCFQNEAEHETPIPDGPGLSESWSVYLAMLDQFRKILGHLMDIVKILT
jgi:Na+/phosphate symporter